jgi:putative pyruvate formate lyase activating enzyme
MDQYRPCYRADEIPGLDHPLGRDEFERVRSIALELGLHRLDPSD